MTTLGKIVGGGLPVGAYGGTRDIMSSVAPRRPRLPGGHALGQPARRRRRHARCSSSSRRPGTYEKLEASRRTLVDGLGGAGARARHRAARRTASARCSPASSRDAPVTDYASAKKSDTARFGKFFHAMLDARRLPGAVAVRGGLRLDRPMTDAPSTARSRPPAAPSPRSSPARTLRRSRWRWRW